MVRPSRLRRRHRRPRLDHVDMLVAGMGDAEPVVKGLCLRVLDIDRQPQIARAPFPSRAGRRPQQSLADRAAAKGVIDIEVLHIDARRAAPGREAREREAHAGERAVDLGDQDFERGMLAETMRPDIIGRRGDLRLPHPMAAPSPEARHGCIPASPASASLIVRIRSHLQNATRSPPLRPSMARASSGVATSSDRPSRMARMRRTCVGIGLGEFPAIVEAVLQPDADIAAHGSRPW